MAELHDREREAILLGTDGAGISMDKGEISMIFHLREPLSVKSLADEFKNSGSAIRNGKLIRFSGVDGFDVYNPSIPFKLGKRTVMAGRVEKRDFFKSNTMFFEKQADGSFSLIPGAHVLEGFEDPAITEIGGDLILAGTRVLWKDNGELITYRAEFYKLHDLNEPEFLFAGPDYMKDIRLLDLKDGRIAITTRPRDDRRMRKLDRLAAIGFTVASGLHEINAQSIDEAPLMQWHFLPDEWGGINQMFLLKNGRIGALGHIACGSQEELHYYSVAQSIDLKTGEVTPFGMIGSRDCYEDAPAKRDALRDVTFTSGIIRKENGKADLYTGLSDSCCGVREIDDPLTEFES